MGVKSRKKKVESTSEFDRFIDDYKKERKALLTEAFLLAKELNGHRAGSHTGRKALAPSTIRDKEQQRS